MGLITGMREASSSFSPSANSVGDGRSTKTMAFEQKAIGVSLQIPLCSGAQVRYLFLTHLSFIYRFLLGEVKKSEH